MLRRVRQSWWLRWCRVIDRHICGVPEWLSDAAVPGPDVPDAPREKPADSDALPMGSLHPTFD